MDDWKKWTIVAGGLVAIVSDFWTGVPFLATIGGAVVVVVVLMQN